MDGYAVIDSDRNEVVDTYADIHLARTAMDMYAETLEDDGNTVCILPAEIVERVQAHDGCLAWWSDFWGGCDLDTQYLIAILDDPERLQALDA